MSMIVHKKPKKTWYALGWEDYESRRSMRAGLTALYINGEDLTDRRSYRSGWRDAMVCDLCDAPSSPKWMKQEMGLI